MASVIRPPRRRRGFFGLLFKYGFILFNLAMAAWLLSYWVWAGQRLSQYTDAASQTGASIGITLGTGSILAFWAAGDVILGLFVLLTRR